MLLEECPISFTLRVLRGKWKPLILNELKGGTLRYGELRRRVPEASQKVMTAQLRQLERCGVICRMVHHDTVLRSEYGLTDFGRSLRPALSALSTWGSRHRMDGESVFAELESSRV